MTAELLILVVGVFVTVRLLQVGSQRPGFAPWAVSLGAAGLAFAGASWRRAEPDVMLQRELPRALRGDGYVSSDACRTCHPSQYRSWHDSYHRTMTQVASPATVRGDFDDVTLRSRGLVYHLERRGSEFWVDMPDPDADFANRAREMHRRVTERDPALPRKKARVAATTGSHHMQTYWVPSDHGRALRNLPFLYLFEDERWVPREDAFLRPPNAGRMMPEWNTNCLKCHSTRPVPGLVTGTNQLDTEVLEFGISCEACHGPGGAHVAANQDPPRRYRRHLDNRPDPTIVNPARLEPRAASQVCGQCHGIYQPQRPLAFAQSGFDYDAGENLERTRYYLRHPSNRNRPADRSGFEPSAAFLEHYYWPDGAVRSTGREYQGMTESACFLRGELSCMSCHSMHESDPNDQLHPRMTGVEACLQCHESYRGNIERHTHHPVASSGSDCYNCHMARTSYGLLTAIRNHQIDGPTLANATENGRPNACNLCHLDRTLAWTRRHLATWYDQREVSLTSEQERIAAGVLWMTRGDAAQRAVVTWHAGWKPAQEASGRDWLAPYLATLLEDPYPAVRYIAYHALRSVPGFEAFAYDYIGPNEHRARSRAEAMTRWRRGSTGGAAPARPAVLITRSGAWQADAARALIRQRDDRELYLAE